MSKYRILTLGFMSGQNGIATSVMNLYRNLDRDLFQFDFLIRKKGRDKAPTNDSYLEEIQDLGGRIYYLNYGYDTIPKHERAKFKHILMSDSSLMGVHVHDLGTNAYPLWAADQLGKPVKVIQFHSAGQKSRVQEVIDSTPRNLKTRLRMISGDQFDRLACSDVAGYCGYRGYSFEVFPNAVDTKKFAYSALYRQLVRGQLGISGDALTLGFVGNFYEVKRPLFVCETFRELFKLRPDAHLIMLGTGQDLEACRDYVRKHPELLKHVHLLGGQDSIDMFYSAMDVLMIPSKLEGFPNVCVEALSAGVSCLVSDEVTDQVCITPLVKQFGYTEPADAWAKQVLQLAEAAPERRSWAAEIKAAGYDIHDAARRLEALYLRRIEG